MAKDKNVKALQTLMNHAVAEGQPGISAAIANSSGVIWTGVAGSANLSNDSAVNPDHLFGIGSITKTFVAVIILQLVEEQRISLGQSALDILTTELVGKVPGVGSATIAQLLNHTGGVPSWEDDPQWIQHGRGCKLQPQRQWLPADTLKYIENSPVLNAAGEKYNYANSNHTLLGLIIEQVTGNDLVTEIRNRILQRAGIEDIYLEGFQSVPTQRLSQRYHYLTDDFVKNAGLHPSFVAINSKIMDVSCSNLSTEWAAGGIVATAADLAKYAAAFRAGKLLSHKSMQFIKQWRPIDKKFKIGHGLFHITLDAGHRFLGHTGSVLGYSSVMHWSESQDLAIVVLSNVGTMHIGTKKQGSAVSLGFDAQFIRHALEYAEGEVGSRKSEVGSRKSEVGSRKSEVARIKKPRTNSYD
ncbi:MAG: beta-lactamase family protein [Pseudomonadales bacterium]|nr:beta-lactamase family protein [Pseudomonadales bacterium]NRA14797.1 beta-lactamase family protein [Oceanospirillaceae bacterium]